MADEIVEKTTVVTELGDAKPNEELEGQIIDQIEYYFGDINLGRDKFMQEEVKKDDGWIPLATMLKFNRLEKLTKDAALIVAALKKSDLMEVSEDKLKIRRSPSRPLQNLTKEELMAKSVYAKGFPLDVTLDQVKEFFRKFGETDNIQMRKDLKKHFKGSCFVIYRDAEGAKKFVETPDVKYNDLDMVRLFKNDYFTKKNLDRKQKSADKGKKADELRQEKETEEREKMIAKITLGAILNVEGIPAGTKREDIKTFFQKFGSVEWVDFDSGDKKGRVRFGAKDEAKSALEKAKEENDGKIKFGESEVDCRVLEGEEEVDHWAVIFKAKQDRQVSSRNKNKRRGGGGDRSHQRGGPQRKKGKKSSADKGGGSGSDKDDDGDE